MSVDAHSGGNSTLHRLGIVHAYYYVCVRLSVLQARPRSIVATKGRAERSHWNPGANLRWHLVHGAKMIIATGAQPLSASFSAKHADAMKRGQVELTSVCHQPQFVHIAQGSTPTLSDR